MISPPIASSAAKPGGLVRWRLGSRRPPWAIVALAAYLLLTFVLFAAAWRDPYHSMVGIGGDPDLAGWFLRWFQFAASHGRNPVLTDYLDYPAGVNLMWNGSMPLVGFILWPVTSTLGPVFAYNLMATLGVGFTAWTAYLFLSRFVVAPVAAFVGGLLFGFSPFVLGHALGHPALYLALFVPVIFILLDETLVRQRSRVLLVGVGLGLAGAAQLLVGEEVLAETVVVGLVGTLVLVAINRDRVRAAAPYAVRVLALAAAVFLVVAGGPLAVQFLGPQQVHGTVQPANTYVSDVLSYIVPTPLQLASPGWATRISDRFAGGLSEGGNAYLGLPLLLLLVVSAVRLWSNRAVQLATVVGVMIGTLALGQTIHFAGRVTQVPVFVIALVFPIFQRFVPARLMLYGVVLLWLGMIDLPILKDFLTNRLALFVDLAAALLLAIAIDAILRSRSTGRSVAGLLAVIIALIPLLPAWPYPATREPIPEFFRSRLVAQVPDGSVALVAPFARGAGYGGAETLLWQAASGMRFRLPEGYVFVPGGAIPYEPGGPSNNPPPSAVQTEMGAIADGAEPPPVDPALRTQLLEELAGWRVETIVVGPMPHQDRMLELFRSILGREPDAEGGVYVWRQVMPGRLLGN